MHRFAGRIGGKQRLAFGLLTANSPAGFGPDWKSRCSIAPLALRFPGDERMWPKCYDDFQFLKRVQKCTPPRAKKFKRLECRLLPPLPVQNDFPAGMDLPTGLRTSNTLNWSTAPERPSSA